MKKLSPSTVYLLKGFLPYSKANLQLTYKPAAFFRELEKLSNSKERTLRSAYYRSIKKGLLIIDDNGIPRLTSRGLRQIDVYKPKVLGKGSFLLITFDIPEADRRKRNHLRALLHELKFKKIQQSVWASRYDHRAYLAAEIADYDLAPYVHVYEAVRLQIQS